MPSPTTMLVPRHSGARDLPVLHSRVPKIVKLEVREFELSLSPNVIPLFDVS